MDAYIYAPISDRKVGDGQKREEMDGADLERLVERAREGDKDAFGDIYRRYFGPVSRIARFHLEPGAAEDAVAETFTRAWANLARFRFRGPPFAAWLYGIARHVVADAARATRRTEPHAEVPDAGADPYPDALNRLAVRRAIDRLPKDQRTIIELKYLMGMTNDEVAAALRKSVGAVNAQQWRALRALREIMGEVR